MKFDLDNQDILDVARVKCDNSLSFFTRFFFKVLKNQKFIMNWHHENLCDAFTRAANYEIVFLNINQPPRTSKTELAVNFVCQNLGKNPSGNYLYITASDDLRSEFSVKVRDIITSKEYKAMYGVELKKDQNSKNLWRTLQGGGLKTATIFGQITGFGAGQMINHDKELEDYIRDFEGCIILDDINKIGDAEASNANNTKAVNRIFDTILSRKNTHDTPLINIQQRAGIEDATSALLEYYKDEPKKESIVLPIISNGIPMWEWKFPITEIEKLKNNPKTKHTFETQYMQNPMPLEGLVYPDKFKTYKEIPKEVTEENGEKVEKEQGWTFAVIDTADKGDDNFAFPIMQIIGSNVYLKDVVFNKNELLTQEDPVQQKSRQYKIVKCVIETNSAGNYFMGRMRKKNKNVNWFGQWSSGNKMSRILANAGLLSRYLYVPEKPTGEMYRFLQQCYRLQKTSKKEDDAPDSLTIGFSHLEKHYKIFD